MARRSAWSTLTSEERQALNAKRGFNTAAQNRRVTGPADSAGEVGDSALPVEDLDQYLFDKAPVYKSQPKFSIADLFSIGHCPTRRRLAAVVGTELTRLIYNVVNAGEYREFFLSCMAHGWVCMCGSCRMLSCFPKRAELWNDCQKAYIASSCKDILDRAARRCYDPVERLPVLLQHSEGWWYPRHAVDPVHYAPSGMHRSTLYHSA